MAEKRIKCALIEKHEVVPGVKRFLFSPEEKLDYKAGQFAFFEFDLDNSEYSKHFTISNSPEREKVEITTMIRESDYKKALDSLEPRHDVYIKGVGGNFTLEEEPEKTIVFLAGGIGITPVKSMLEYAIDKGLSMKAKLFYSNREKKFIAYEKELDSIMGNLDDLEIIHTLTDISHEEVSSWKGETGFIDQKMIETHVKEPDSSIFYISGPPSFNEAMNKMLKEQIGLNKENVKTENFSGY